MNIKDLIAEVRAHDVSANPGPWRTQICVESDLIDTHSSIKGNGYLLVDNAEHADAALIAHYRTAAPLLAAEVERLTTAIDESKAADLHRNLNRRVAAALGLLDERVDAATGETYLPSWHDMPEQVTALRAEVERLNAANEELRLTLAAEQGRAEGAPSERWRYVHTGDGHGWALPTPNADSAAADEWARMDYRIRPLPHCDVSRISGGIWFLRWHPDLRRDSTGHYTARAAMLAAKDGA